MAWLDIFSYVRCAGAVAIGQNYMTCRCCHVSELIVTWTRPKSIWRFIDKLSLSDLGVELVTVSKTIEIVTEIVCSLFYFAVFLTISNCSSFYSTWNVSNCQVGCNTLFTTDAQLSCHQKVLVELYLVYNRTQQIQSDFLGDSVLATRLCTENAADVQLLVSDIHRVHIKKIPLIFSP